MFALGIHGEISKYCLSMVLRTLKNANIVTRECCRQLRCAVAIPENSRVFCKYLGKKGSKCFKSCDLGHRKKFW